MLDRYLENLTKEASDQHDVERALKKMSISELAKLAGVKLAYNVCASCGSTMEKRGSMLRCSCGMMKAAVAKCSETPQAELEGRIKKVTGATPSNELELPAAGKPTENVEPSVLKEKKAAKRDMPPFLKQDRPAKVKEVYKALKRDHPEYSAGKKARIASSKGKKKTSEVDHELLKIGEQAGKLLAKTSAMPETLDELDPLSRDILMMTPERAAALSAPAGGVLGAGLGALTIPGKTRLLAAALGAGVGAGSAALGGYGGARLGEFLSGKINPKLMEAVRAERERLAEKTSGINDTPVSPEELEESIQEAHGREDIPGRSRAWQIGGGIGGGILGAAPGAAIGALTKRRILGLGLGAVGAGAGAGFGQHVGKQYGAEEAAADKAVALLRALRAHQAGAGAGYGAGLRQGYAAGRGFGDESSGG